MRISILLCLLIGNSLPLMAQEEISEQDSVMETDAAKKAGFWLAAYLEPAYTREIPGINLGAGGSFVYNEQFSLGIYGVVFAGEFRSRLIFPNEFRLNYSHAGIWAGYKTRRAKIVEFTADIKAGEGKVFWERLDNYDNMFEDYALFITPSAGIDIKFLKIFALHTELGYRLVRGTDIPRFTDTDFSGVSFILMVKVGVF